MKDSLQKITVKNLETLELKNPPYQRRFIWSKEKMQGLFTSILNGLFIGVMTIMKTERGLYICDGQQRIITIIKILNDEFKWSNDLVAIEMPFLKNEQLHNKSLSEMQKSFKLKFLNYKLSICFLESRNKREQESQFFAMNTYAVPLNAEEKRNAIIHGTVAAMRKRVAAHPVFSKIITEKSKSRMKDYEYATELIWMATTGDVHNRTRGITEFMLTHADGSSKQLKYSENIITEVQDTIHNLLEDIPNKTGFPWGIIHHYSLFYAIMRLFNDGRKIKDMDGAKEELKKLTAEFRSLKDSKFNYISEYKEECKEGTASYKARKTRGRILFERLYKYFN